MINSRAAGKFSLAGLAFVFICGCSAPLGEKIPPAEMNNLKLLSTYGRFHGNQLTSETWRQEVEREVQNRDLLTVAEVMQLQQKKNYIGQSSAATLALNGLPQAWGSSPRYPGVDVWVYGTGIYWVKGDNHFFISRGKLVGWHSVELLQTGSAGAHRWRNDGQTFNIHDWQLTPCQALGDSPCAGLKVATSKGTDAAAKQP